MYAESNIELGNPVAQLTSAAVKLYSLTHGDSKITKFKMHQNLRNLEHSKTLRLGLRRLNLRWKPGGAFCFLVHFQCFAFIPKACPSAECNKKVIEEGHGAYRCEKCNKTYPDFKYRLMLLVSVK